MFMNLHLNKLSASGENSWLLLHNVTKKVKTLGEYPQIHVLVSAISKTTEKDWFLQENRCSPKNKNKNK